ncbi:MAG: RNA polymerase sigma-70 factor [Tannerellaceae bacterium]|jgi:RNA polymerase sigma-70 factor (ECF subfamily)|nr:RNA polymerase sigma-70 factor [Tannerellaceae bacterium]
MEVEILYALKQGSESAFEAIFRKYNAKIYHFVAASLYNKDLAEDITQNVFLSVWEHRSGIIPEKNFQAYLYTIAKNLVFKETEKMILAFRYEEHVNNTTLGEIDLSTEEQIFTDSLEDMIFRLIGKLPKARREIFLLSFMENLNNKEISEKLSISEKNVGMQIRRSRDYIRKYLKDYIAFLLF